MLFQCRQFRNAPNGRWRRTVQSPPKRCLGWAPIPNRKEEGALMKKILPGAALLAVVPLVLFSAPVFPYDAVSVSGGGTIAGKVVYQGSVPVKKIIPTKDKEVCGSPRDEPQVLVGPDKGVEDAAIYLKEVPKGKAWGKLEKTPVLDNKHCQFDPPIQVIRVGSLDVHNSDPVLHNTHGFYGKRTAFNMA